MIYIMLPAYNEEGSITSCITRIAGVMGKAVLPYRIVIVNDGSTDRTLDIISKLRGHIPLEIVSHTVNKGVGQVFRTGFNYVCRECRPEDIVVAMESDNTNDPAILPVMIEKIDKEGFDVVCASRYVSGGSYEGFPFMRLVLSKAANNILRLYFRIPQIRDYTIFFRAYKAGILKNALNYYKDKFIESRGFVCNAEILIKLRPFAARCTEVPFIYRYDMKAGASKLKISITVWEYFRFMILNGTVPFSERKCRK